jgi:hypothetical protein
MSTAINEVATAALKLEPKHRASLALRLIDSLDSDEDLPQSEVDRLWLVEADERLRELETGESELVPASQVIQNARDLLK